MVKIALSAYNGFIGHQLRNYLTQQGYVIIPIDRKDFDDEKTLQSKVEQSDIVIHLSGSPILNRWTNSQKRKIRNSRIETTLRLSNAILKAEQKPHLYISTSAIGIYDTINIHDENSKVFSSSFLGNLCKEWEAAAKILNDQMDVVVFRLGVVLGSNGGALQRMLKPYKLGLGGIIGKGTQNMSWIHIEDLLSAYQFVISKGLRGTFNLCSPSYTSNREFTKTVSALLKKPAFFKIPEWMLKVIYGKASTVITDNLRVVPKRLLDNGFKFRYPEITEAIKNILHK